MKAERNNAANTLRGTLLLRWRSPGTLAKDRDRHPLKAPCLHLSQKSVAQTSVCGSSRQVLLLQRPSQTKVCATSQIGTSIVKKLKERALSLPGKLPAPSILREFCFEIWERESAPAD